MKKITLTHEIDCSAEHFWKVFFDEEFNNKLFIGELGFPEYELVKQDENGGNIKRTVRGRPKMNAPKAVQKVLGDSFGYEEEGTYEQSTGVWNWQMHPNTLKGKLNNRGSVRVEAISDTKCRRIAEITMEAKIFGVGGLIEGSTEKEMTIGWNASAAFMNKWLAEHPQA